MTRDTGEDHNENEVGKRTLWYRGSEGCGNPDFRGGIKAEGSWPF